MKTKKIKEKKGKSLIKDNPIKKDKKVKRKKGKKGKENKKSGTKSKVTEDYDYDQGGGISPSEEMYVEPPEVFGLVEEYEESPMPIKVKRVSKMKGKKSKKIPKIRRVATRENVEDNYMIVPWESSEEWNGVCSQLHCGLYQEVMSKIAVWQRRVQSLPVGVEATLFLLEALVYDQKLLRSTSNNDKVGLYTEDQARALYSLAIIRYLNHVNHLAAQSLGETSSRPAQELAAMMDTPDWLVTLRNDVSHGTRAPSLEVLRMGGNFVLQWLKGKYWKLPGNDETTDPNDPFTVIGQNDRADVPQEISALLSAYVAARIYNKRHQSMISDPDIISLITTSQSENFLPVKTKVAVTSLKNALRDFLVNSPSVFCTVASQELIPSMEFFEDFTSIFRKKSKKGDSATDNDHNNQIPQSFEQLHAIWMPIMKMLESKGKLVTVLSNLCELMVDSDNEKMWMITALWIDNILEMIEVSGKKYSKHLVGILKGLIKHPNVHIRIFLERFFRLTEPRVGPETIQKLDFLVNIWLDGQEETRKRRKSSQVKLFSLSDVENQNQNGSSQMDDGDDECMSSLIWKPDQRGEEFWRNIPLGGFL